MKTLDEVLVAVNGESARENISLYWSDSQNVYPEGGPKELEESCVRENARIATFPDDMIDMIVGVAEQIRSDECLSRYYWHAYWRNYLVPNWNPPTTAWPEPAVLGEKRGVFFVLVGIAVVPLIQKNHDRLGITGAVTNTAQQVARYCFDNYCRGNDGRYGIYINQLGWLRHYTEKPYVRLGRMSYCMEPTKRDYIVYRNMKTGQTVCLAPDGARYSAAGYRVSADNEDAGNWKASLTVTPEAVTGSPIIPDGHAEQNQVTLPKNEWHQMFGPGDTCLSMHIPSGGGLTLEAARDSFMQARAFFQKHFPNNPPKAIVCGSWIFNPQLPEILGADAHLPQLQRELYLVPTPTNSTEGLWFIYLRNGAPDPATWPQNTSLQRKVMKYITDGGQWRGGGMFFLFEDVEAFGTQKYLNDFKI